MVEWDAEIVLSEDETGTMSFRVMIGEEDYGTADSRNVGQSRPPLPDKVSTFRVPWRKWMRIDVD